MRWVGKLVAFGGIFLCTAGFPSLGLAHDALSLDATLKAADSATEEVTLLGSRHEIRLVSRKEWSSLTKIIEEVVRTSEVRLQALLGPAPLMDTTIRLMDEETFFLATGAPRWTNAIFYRGQIILPVQQTQIIDRENLVRSIRHEFTHAFLYALSGGRCPGWLDEGLAQWAEGAENAALRPALYDYLRSSPPVPFRLMQGGFTRLENRMVAAAYAQSLLAAQSLIETGGFRAIRRYLAALRDGTSAEEAFEGAFKLSAGDFEARFNGKLSRWADSYAQVNLVSARLRQKFPPERTTLGELRARSRR